MPIIEGATHIDRPVADVWAFVTDVANTPVWNPMWESQHLVGSFPMGLGSRFHNVWRLLGRRMEADAEVTLWDPPYRSAVRALDGPFRAEGSYLLEEEADGTRFVWRLDAASGFGGLFGRVTDAAVARVASKHVQAGLESLRTILEEQLEHNVVPDTPGTA